ncbi:hypothetical protein FIA58_018120 [Flavobacterium jejuense]|uniref:LysM domain-containing protein n=1 Tax=Flavobacterium jejuense TaxID=1544455 RepID=A0ABX0IWP0_9FLAO|nr:hypothetical protein [Flavobacterium jejuense]NHN27601.1 hypothetical protein [Flavobacterium jejuense]
MKPKYKKYKIQKGDTLQSVSEKLDKTTHEVKNFHNVFCDSDEYIGVTFPKGLKELYIYPTYNEKELSLIPKVPFDDAFKLSLKPTQNKINYGVMYTIKSGNEENTLKFEVSVIYKGKNEKDNLVFEVDKISKTFINDEEVNTIADELAIKTSDVLYPLEVNITEEGKWIGVNNYKEINKRWEQIKEKILDEYEGEWVERYLLLNEKTLGNEDDLLGSLQKDWFLNSYFNTIYVYYSHKFKFQTSTTFPILSNCKSVSYDIEQKIEEYLDEYNLIRIEQKGELKEERSKADLENEMNIPYYGVLYPNRDIAKGNYRSLYFLNGKTNLIESLFLECSIELEVMKEIQVVVSLL